MQAVVERVLRDGLVEHLARRRRLAAHVEQEPRVLDGQSRGYCLVLGRRYVALVQLGALIEVASPTLKVDASV